MQKAKSASGERQADGLALHVVCNFQEKVNDIAGSEAFDLGLLFGKGFQAETEDKQVLSFEYTSLQEFVAAKYISQIQQVIFSGLIWDFCHLGYFSN